jgi:outer membrane protein
VTIHLFGETVMTARTHLIPFWTLVMTGLLTFPVAAQQPVVPAATPQRFAWVNFREIVANMPGYAAAESLLTNELSTAQAEVQRLQVQLDSMVRAFDQQQIALSQSARQQRQTELRDTQLRFQQRAQELEETIAQREREVFGPLEQRARVVLEGLRAERNLAFIFDVSAPGSNILTADQALNITALAISRLTTEQ